MAAETIPGLLQQRASDSPTMEAIVGDAERVTYTTLDRLSAERAAWLVARGVNKGHRVGLMMPNSVEWVVNAYAVMRIGAVLVPLSTLLRPVELTGQLAVAGVRHLIAARAFRGRDYQEEITGLDRAMLPSLRDIWWADDLTGEVDKTARDIAVALAARVRPADDMAIIFTSGSRSTPRGVIHSHGSAIRANAAGLADRCVRPGVRLYLPMPFFWVGGFAGGLISALNTGATLLTEAAPEPHGTLAFLAREQVTLFRGWPDQARQIAAHADFASTDLSALAPGSLDPLLPPAKRARPGSRANLFGMTETFGPYCGYPLDENMPEDKWGSCGRAFAGMRLRIVDPETGAHLLDGEMGSIQVSGRNILRGICGLEREAVFTPDGWYDGGDMGRVDADGYLWFMGRKDDMVKVKGATVYPSEIEAALESIPGIVRAFATDISIDGAMAMGAAVVWGGPSDIDAAQLVSGARERLSAFKLPARWAILQSMDELPRTTTGKVDKPALQALLLSKADKID